MLEACLDGMKKCRYTMSASVFRNALAKALCANGDARRALVVCEEAIQAIEINGDELYLPMLRMTKADALSAIEEHEASMSSLREALVLAKKQGAVAFASQIERTGRLES